MIRTTIVWSSVLVVGLSATSPVVLAQGSQTGSVTGTIRDATGAMLAGVAVTLSSPNLIGGDRRTTSDARGAYRFVALPSGLYEVTAEVPRFKTVRRGDLLVPIGATITLDLDLELGTFGEIVEVAATREAIDRRSAAAPTHVDEALLQNLPVRRDLASVINLTPGVTAGVAFGGTQGSNALFVDGVNMTEPSFGGRFESSNTNWIQEVQVVVLGASAEHGGSSGATVNAVLRSGSNRFSGLGEFFAVRPNSADRQRNQTLERWESSEQVGGPLMKDRLWFFSGFQYSRYVRRPAGFTGPEVTADRSPKFITKINAAPTSRIRVEGFYEQDNPEEAGEGLGFLPPEAVWLYQNPHKTWNARATWTATDRTLVEARAGGYRGVDANEPTPPNTRSGPAPHVETLTGNTSGNVPYFFSYAPKPVSMAVTLTRYADGFLGKSHELKVGLEYERSTALDEFGYPGGRQYLDVGGQPDLVILEETEFSDPTNTRTVVYAQDAWTLTDRLTISPGLRFSMNRGSVPDRGDVFSTNPVSPRIGFAWDVAADHQTVVRAHYGRYHDALLNNHFQFMHTSGYGPVIIARVLGPNQFQELDRSEPSTAMGIDPALTQSFVDQYFFGVERELLSGFSLQTHVIRRNFKNFMGFVDAGSIYAPLRAQDPGPDGRAGTPDDGAILTVFNKTNPGHAFFLMTNPDGAYRRYSAFEIVGRKRYSRNWQMLASYTWSRTVGNTNNRSGTNAGIFDAGQGGVFANPNVAINADGPTAFDYTHEVKIAGHYRVPFWQGVNVSGIYRYRTGLAWGRVATFRGLNQGGETIRVEPRGTRRLPALNSFDLRLEKTFHAGSAARLLGLFVDIFNVNDQAIPNSDNRYAVNEASGSRLGSFGPSIDPRTLRGGIRFTF